MPYEKELHLAEEERDKLKELCDRAYRRFKAWEWYFAPPPNPIKLAAHH